MDFRPPAPLLRTGVFALVSVALCSVAFCLVPLEIGAQSIWPERAQNLTELPADFPAERLRAVMQGFSRALGVRCSHCHVGEEGAPLSTYDFASDANPNKERARAMLRMLGDINAHLAEIEPSADDRVNMWCHTCHAGRPRPMTLEETLLAAYGNSGTAEAVTERFLELRDSFYGGNQYDFRPPSVAGVSQRFLTSGDTAVAVRLLELNSGHFPRWAPGHERLGDLALARGDQAAAVAHYEDASELDPGNQRVARKLLNARSGGGTPSPR